MNTTPNGTRQQILGTPVDNVDLDGTIEHIAGWLRDSPDTLKHVVTVNPEFVIAAYRNPEFMSVLRRSSLATADGVGIGLAARLLGLSIGERVTGVDLVQELARTAPDNSRLFLLGAAEGVAAEAALALQRQYPDVEIAGMYGGSFKDDRFSEIEVYLIRARPTVLLVAFGHPAQDLWIDRHREHLRKHGILVAIGVGGTFDYLSGRVPRAPRLVRRLGFEWLYRLIRQPWRWRRQLALPLFVMLVVRERLRRARRSTI
jgi:N-acetylglucosaminyldiphosphoundecaprenol N-acetyl-beta-D-mannosaminyltransferase